MLHGVRFRISRTTTCDMRHATCKTQRGLLSRFAHACRAFWYGFGRLAHQVVRPPSRRGQRPRRRRQAAARRRRDRRQREGLERVRSCCVFLFSLPQKGPRRRVRLWFIYYVLLLRRIRLCCMFLFYFTPKGQHATCQHVDISTCDMRQETCDMQHATCDT